MSRRKLAFLMVILTLACFGSSPALANKSSFVDFGFEGATHFTSVRFQQGRVLLDEDFNESFELRISAKVDTALLDLVIIPDFSEIPLGCLSHTGEREDSVFRFFTADPHFREAVSNPDDFPIEIIIRTNGARKGTTLYTSTFTAVPSTSAFWIAGASSYHFIHFHFYCGAIAGKSGTVGFGSFDAGKGEKKVKMEIR